MSENRNQDSNSVLREAALIDEHNKFLQDAVFRNGVDFGFRDKETRSNFLSGIKHLYVETERARQYLLDEDDVMLSIFPMRGAAAAYWGIDEAYKLLGYDEGISSFGPVLLLPVGTATDLVTGNLVGGIEEGQKKAILNDFFKTVLDEKPYGLGLRTFVKRLVLVDEVQSGGMISKLLDSLISVSKIHWTDHDQDSPGISVIGCQGEAFKRSSKSKKYQSLLYGQYPDKVSFHAVNLPFGIDQPRKLPAILHLPSFIQQARGRNGESRMRVSETRELFTNPFAEGQVRRLIRSHLLPETLLSQD